MLMLMPKASLRLGKDPWVTGATQLSTLLLGIGLSFETNKTFLSGLDVGGFVFSNNERIESLGCWIDSFLGILKFNEDVDAILFRPE